MKFKRLFAAALSLCLLLGIAPAYAAPGEAPGPAAALEEVVPIPGDLIGAMEEEADGLFRFPSLRESAQFFRELPRLARVLNNRARTVSSSRDLAALDSACSLNKTGPIGVAAAELNGQPVTLLVLGGTVPVRGQATGFREDVLAAMEQSNDYLRNVVKLFDAARTDGTPVIPADRPVIVSGISLGGMIAQQLLAQKDLMARFDIQAILCFGSPLIAPEHRAQGCL